MRSRGIVVAMIGSLLLVLLGPSGAAPAAVVFRGDTTTHAAGMPTATEPWRTLVRGGVVAETTYDDVDVWTATAQLGGAIPEGESVEIRWTTGRRNQDRCAPIATFVERTTTADTDHSVTISPTTFGPDDQVDEFDPTPLCLEISLVSRGVQSDLLVGPVVADDAAAAVVGVSARATEHAPGHPSTTEPWRTLTSASLEGDLMSRTVRLSATFAGPVPEGQPHTVGWYLGRQHPHGCEVLVSFAMVDPALDSNHTMSQELRYDHGDLASDFSCFEVGLYTGGGAQSDRLVGVSSPIVADVAVDAVPTGREFVVAAGRRTPVIVMASSRIGARRGLTITARGHGVRAARTSTGALEARRFRPVVLRVDAKRPGKSRLVLSARDARFDEAHSRASWPVLARRIEAQRPRPGRYRSPDGSVRFRVSSEFVVTGLRAARVRCADVDKRPTVRLRHDVRLPRNGATARVARSRDADVGKGFVGAQLLTTSATHVVGTLVVSTRGCDGLVRFTAERRPGHARGN